MGNFAVAEKADQRQIAESGLFKGSVEIDEADIGGRFEGDITVRGTLKVRASGRITGTIRYGQLEVEQGGRLGVRPAGLTREAAGHDLAVALTLFVTLEPCAFVGRTPSCARAIVDSGIRRVYVGTLDPDPRNNGAGIAIMREAGIDVTVGVDQAQVLDFIAPYLSSAPRT